MFYFKWHVKTIRCNVLNFKNIYYLNVKWVLIIHYENIIKLYLLYLKYIQNISLFHSKILNIFLFEILLKIYKPWPP
jgi:hypothetical protein